MGDALAERLTAALKQMKVGPGTEPGNDMGPLVTQAHFEKVKGYVDAGVAEGATLVRIGTAIFGARMKGGLAA